jgi:hypothetical protein
MGFVEPALCNTKIWTKDTAAIMKGKTKCKLKNLFNVALSIANPPHNHIAMLSPTKGIAEAKFVMTVAPQKLI